MTINMNLTKKIRTTKGIKTINRCKAQQKNLFSNGCVIFEFMKFMKMNEVNESMLNSASKLEKKSAHSKPALLVGVTAAGRFALLTAARWGEKVKMTGDARVATWSGKICVDTVTGTTRLRI